MYDESQQISPVVPVSAALDGVLVVAMRMMLPGLTTTFAADPLSVTFVQDVVPISVSFDAAVMPTPMTIAPVVLAALVSAFDPMQILLPPVVGRSPASKPTKVLLPAVVTRSPDPRPTNVLFAPLVFFVPAKYPMQVSPVPVFPPAPPAPAVKYPIPTAPSTVFAPHAPVPTPVA